MNEQNAENPNKTPILNGSAPNGLMISIQVHDLCPKAALIPLNLQMQS
jgi:hypothetical protein